MSQATDNPLANLQCHCGKPMTAEDINNDCDGLTTRGYLERGGFLCIECRTESDKAFEDDTEDDDDQE